MRQCSRGPGREAWGGDRPRAQLPCLAEWPDRDFLPDICTRWQGPRAIREAVFPAEPWGTPQAVLLPAPPQATGGGQEFITVRVPRGCGLAGEGPGGSQGLGWEHHPSSGLPAGMPPLPGPWAFPSPPGGDRQGRGRALIGREEKEGSPAPLPVGGWSPVMRVRNGPSEGPGLHGNREALGWGQCGAGEVLCRGRRPRGVLRRS